LCKFLAALLVFLRVLGDADAFLDRFGQCQVYMCFVVQDWLSTGYINLHKVQVFFALHQVTEQPLLYAYLLATSN